jgi:hypothetical protein
VSQYDEAPQYSLIKITFEKDFFMIFTIKHWFISLILKKKKKLETPSGWYGTKEVLQKKSGRRLCYIYSRCTYMELFQWLVAPLVLKFGIHQRQA